MLRTKENRNAVPVTRVTNRGRISVHNATLLILRFVNRRGYCDDPFGRLKTGCPRFITHNRGEVKFTP